MNKITKIIFIFLATTTFVFGASKGGEVTSQLSLMDETAGPQHSQESRDTIWLIDDPKFIKCKGLRGAKATGCISTIWNDGSISDDDKEKLRKKFEELKTGPSSQYSESSFGENETEKKISTYLKERLADIIHNSDGESLKVFDQRDYFSLYNTQLSKNAITALNSYCIDANLSSNDFLISMDEDQRIAQREANLKGLAQWDPSDPNSSSPYTSCIGAIPSICDPCLKPGIDKNTCHGDLSKSIIMDDQGDSDKTYSQKRACEVKITLEKIRDAMSSISDLSNELDNNQLLNKNGPNLISDSKKVKLSSSDLNFNEATSISSKELRDRAKVKDSPTTNGPSDAEISDYDTSSDNILEKQAQELELKDLMAKHEIESAFKKAKEGDDSDLRKLLQEKGYSDTRIKGLLSGNYETTLRDELFHQLRLKKETIIKRTRDKVKATIGQASKSGDQRSIAANRTNIPSPEKQLEQLVHFNNVVTSFLPIGGSNGGKTIRNALTLSLEVDNTTFEEQRDRSQYGKFEVDHLKEIAMDHQAFSGNRDELVCININDLNNLILGPENKSAASDASDNLSIGCK